jgi:excisionase family DNA binding protein
MSTTAEALDKLTRRIAALEKAAKAPDRRSWRPREVAQMTGVSYDKVLELIEDGELGSFKVGRLNLVPDTDLQAFINSGGGEPR